LKAFFKHKAPEQIDDLFKLAMEELGTADDSVTRIEYRHLFKEDSEGRYGPFVNKIRSQMKEENSTFANQIRDTIGPKK
jgi:hypothetical protein